MTCTTRPLLDPQLRALATAAGLVGRPRLRSGLALTLAFACGPAPEDVGPGEGGETTLVDVGSTLAPTTEPASSGSTGERTSTTGTGELTSTTGTGSSGDFTGSSGDGTTLLTDATTIVDETTGTDTGDSTGVSTGTGETGELDDCVIDRTTMEVDWACCEAQRWQPAPQCTPWGPPAPPSAGRLSWARAARRVLS